MVPNDAPAPEREQPAKARVFISYSRKDIDFANRLDAALRTRGFEPLIDRSDIYAFEEWWQRIEALISRADTVVFVISPDAVASDVALKEVAHAASLNKRFAPIVCRRVHNEHIPEVLRRLNFIFFDDAQQFERNVDQLADALNTDIAWIRQHTEFGEQARRWALAQGSNGLLLRSPMLEKAERWIASRPRGAPAPTGETQTFVTHSRQAATRRRNAMTGSLAAGLGVALSLAGLAYWQRGVAVEQAQIAAERQLFAEQQQGLAEQQRQIAQEQREVAQRNEEQAKAERDKATRNFKLAQRTADSLVVDIAQGLRDVHGVTAETVRKVLQTARATFEQLTTAAPDDLGLQRSREALLSQFGDTYLTLGDLDQALRSYRDSLAIAERLALPDPSNTGRQRDLSVAYDRIGTTLAMQGKRNDALKAHRKGLAIIETLAAANPKNMLWQADMAAAYDRIGSLLAGDPNAKNMLWRAEMEADYGLLNLNDALDAYTNSFSIRQRLAAAEPDNTQWQWELSISHEKIGDVLTQQGKFHQALTAYREGIAISERLASADRSNTRLQRELAMSYERIGDVLAARDKLEEAFTAYSHSFAIRERLVASDRNNTEWRNDLYFSYMKTGNILVSQGKLDKALERHRAALDIAQALSDSDGSNAQWQTNLSAAYEKVGDGLRAQGNIDDALKVYHDSLAIRKRLAPADFSNPQSQRNLAVIHGKLGSVYEQQLLISKAIQEFIEAKVLLAVPVAIVPGNTQWKNELAWYDRQIIRLEAQQKPGAR